MKKEALISNGNGSNTGVIRVSLGDDYPKKIIVMNGPKVYETYELKKTKNDRFMLQK